MAQSTGVPLNHSCRCGSEIRSIKLLATWPWSVPNPRHELDIPIVMKVARVHSSARDETVAVSILVCPLASLAMS